MENAISTYWLPINSKEALKFYLEADRLALGKKSNTAKLRITDALGITSLIWRYLRLLRTAEYFHNCKHSFIFKLYKAYLSFRLRRFSLRLGFEIPLNVFGPGLRISHYGSIVVNGNARVGANCSLINLLNIGQKTERDDASPTIGDNVFIGSGARVLGSITIADGTVIGANSVVTESVLEPYTTVAGAPARKISECGTESFWPAGERDALLNYLAAHKERFSTNEREVFVRGGFSI
ncbi:MAG: serine O-acetyltransferase [Halobacteriota archaeon]